MQEGKKPIDVDAHLTDGGERIPGAEQLPHSTEPVVVQASAQSPSGWRFALSYRGPARLVPLLATLVGLGLAVFIDATRTGWFAHVLSVIVLLVAVSFGWIYRRRADR